MLELEITAAQAALEDFVPKPGKERPFALLSFSMQGDASLLDYFGPRADLKAIYFDPDAPADLADGMPLRDPHAVYPHKRDEEMTGATVKIGLGIGAPMVFPDAVIDQFEITPMEGSRVVLAFRAKVYPDEGQAGRLFMAQATHVELTVEPMELATMPAAA